MNRMRVPKYVLVAAAVAALGACKTNQTTDDGGATTAGTSGDSTGTGGAGGTGGTGGTGASGTSIPALVNVDLRNVLNNLSVDLKVDRANIPVNAQVPIDVAANVCGVSISALSASIANGQASCTAKTTSPQLAQAVQQQVSAGGDVGGGDQTMNFY
jgi:hypothetical protein